MTFLKGQPKIGGRTAGTPNQDHPAVFCRLLATLLPTSVEVSAEGATLEELLADAHRRPTERPQDQRAGSPSA